MRKKTKKYKTVLRKKITENGRIKNLIKLTEEFIPPNEGIVNPNTLFQKKQINKNEDKNFNK